MATTEVVITVRYSAEGNGHGISADAETLVDVCCCYGGPADSSLGGAEDELRKALALIEERSEAEYDRLVSDRSSSGE